MPLNQFVPVCPKSCACHSRCTGHKVLWMRSSQSWDASRDRDDVAGCIADCRLGCTCGATCTDCCRNKQLRLSHAADAPWEKYSCICMDGLSCTLLWCTARLADFWLSMSLLNTLKNYGPVKHAPSLSMTSLQFSSKYPCCFLVLPCQNCDSKGQGNQHNFEEFNMCEQANLYRSEHCAALLCSAIRWLPGSRSGPGPGLGGEYEEMTDICWHTPPIVQCIASSHQLTIHIVH